MSDRLNVNDKAKKHVGALRQACHTARLRYMPQWRAALRRLPGFLEDDVPTTEETVTEGRDQEIQIVSTVNLAYRNWMAALARQLPRLRQLQGIAASREPQDLRAAFSVERMLRNELLGHMGRYSDELIRGLSFVWCCYKAAWHVEGVVKQGEESGDVRLVAHSPFEVFYWPGVKRVGESPSAFIDEFVTKQYIEERWVVGKDLEARWAAIEKTLPGAQWSEESGMGYTQPGIDQSLHMVTRLYIKPCKEFKNGAQKILIGDKLFTEIKVDGEHTIGTPDGEYPIIEAADIPVGHLDYSETRMNLIQGSQRLFEETYSRWAEAMTTQAVYTNWVPDVSGITPDSRTNKPVETVAYRSMSSHKPEVEVIPEASAMLGAMGFLMRLIDDVHGQSPVSRGQSQGSRMPVGTMQALIERAEGQDYALVERLKNAVARLAQRIVIEGQAVWSDKKTFLVLGAHRKYEAIEFKKADLKEGFSVRIRPEDGMPRTMEARWEKVTKGVEAGLFGPPQEPATAKIARELLDIMDAEGSEYSFDQTHKQKAMDDFLALKGGTDPGVGYYENHRVHIEHEAELAVEETTRTQQALDGEFEGRLKEHRKEHILMQQERNADELAMTKLPPEVQAAEIAEQADAQAATQPPPEEEEGPRARGP